MKTQMNARISDSTRGKLDWLTDNRYGTQAEVLAVAIDRLYQDERGARNVDITVEFSDDGLFGPDPDATSGVDIEASREAFAEGLAAELLRAFPGAVVEVNAGNDDYHRVDGRGDSDEAAEVGEIVRGYWEGWTWVVNA